MINQSIRNRMKSMKTGRAAHEYIRDQAIELVNAYRPIANSPDDPVCLNPDDAEEDRTYISKDRAFAHLLSALESFSENGSFASPIDVRRFSIREDYRNMRRAGMIRAQAITLLMDRYHLGKTTVEDMIKTVKINLSEHVNPDE